MVIGSLGTISKDLESIPFNGEKRYVKGAMGCVLGIGLGYALGSEKRVLVLIGDGSLLMKMGSLASILRYRLKNLRVAIINNRSYASCGGQQTNFKYVENLLSHDGQPYNSRAYKVFEISE